MITITTAFTTSLEAHQKHPARSADVSGVISLDSAVNGSMVAMVTTFAVGKKRELQFQKSSDGGRSWSEPRTLATGEVYTPNRGYFPQIAWAGKKLAVLYAVTGKTKFGGGLLQTLFSEDEGTTWQPGSTPIDDPKVDSAAFQDLTSDNKGNLHAVWLDSRGGVQGLRYAQSKDFGKSWEPSNTIMAKTCECCWNRIYVGDDGELNVIYRACDPRDMALARSSDGGKTWKKTSDVGQFNWDIRACPHMGGALNRSKDSLQALVWTGLKNKTGLYFLDSSDRGLNWSAPTRVGSSLAREGDLASRGQTVAMVWQDMNKGTEAIQIQSSVDGGKTWNQSKTLSQPDLYSRHPQILALPDHFLVTWITTEKGKSQLSSQIWGEP